MIELLPETFIVFRNNLDEARHHIGHACAHAACNLLVSADIDLDYAIDALNRARKKLGLGFVTKSHPQTNTTKGN